MADDAKFCGKCGAEVNQKIPDPELPKNSGKKKIILVVFGILILTAILAALFIVIKDKQAAKEYENYIAMAEKYVEELGYETELFKTFESSVEESTKCTYKYDEAGNCIEEKTYSSLGDVSTVYTYKYDEKGNKVSGELYSFGEFMADIVYEYDKTGKCVKEVLNNIYGNTMETVYEYDSNGNCIRKKYMVLKVRWKAKRNISTDNGNLQ